MIKVSVMYPNKPGARFNHDYYRDKHMPLVKAQMGDKCKYYTIDKGLAGGAPHLRDLRRHVPHLLRLSRELPGGLQPSRKGNHGRHPELHRPRASDPDQRSGRRFTERTLNSGSATSARSQRWSSAAAGEQQSNEPYVGWNDLLACIGLELDARH